MNSFKTVSCRLLAVSFIFSVLIGCSTGAKKSSGKGEDPQMAQALIRYEYAPGELNQLCDAAMAETTRRLDQIAAVPAAARTIENVLLAFEQAIADLSDATGPLVFMNYVSTDQRVREEGAACEEKLGQYAVGVMTRKDVYLAIKGVSASEKEQRALQKEILLGYELNGLELADQKLEELRKLKQQLSVLQTQFGTNLNKDTTTIEFSGEELKGVTADFLARLKRAANGNYIVTMAAPDYQHVMENAKNRETRKRMAYAYANRQAETNTKLLEEALLLRQKIAPMLGFKTWADYRTKGRMAKSGKEVLQFLNGLKGKLAQRNERDLAKLLGFIRSQDPSIERIRPWDIPYAEYQLKRTEYQLDVERIREFFPAQQLMARMFDVYSRLLGLKFVEVKGAKVWAPEVQLFEVHDAASGELLAYFYADLFPRTGKYSHFAAFPLLVGRRINGVQGKPVASIVGNFSPPSEGKPSLLTHNEVETVFHEFGHIMHMVLSRVPYSILSGFNALPEFSIAQDFVETPSQMLEEWVWSPEILSGLSGHYKDPAQQLPSDLVQKIMAARDFNRGYFYTRQLMLALTDMTYHTKKGPIDTAAVYDRHFREIIGVEPVEGGHFAAGFGHLMGGYDAGYYGYLWSEVYAQDLFTSFAKGGMLNPEVGVKYRRAVLEKGKMEAPGLLLKDFLGRAPNSKAFFRRLGIR